MSDLQNTIVTIVTPAGEFVGRLKHDAPGKVTLREPLMFMNTEQGMGFLPGVSMTGIQNPKEVDFYNVVLMVEASEQTEQAWTKATSGIVI
jgi:hypothetical protein